MEIEYDLHELNKLCTSFKDNLKKKYGKTIYDLNDEKYRYCGDYHIEENGPTMSRIVNYCSFDLPEYYCDCNDGDGWHTHCICGETLKNPHFIINSNYEEDSILQIGSSCITKFKICDKKRKCLICDKNNCRPLIDKKTNLENHNFCVNHKYYEYCSNEYCKKIIPMDNSEHKKLLKHFYKKDYRLMRKEIICSTCNKIKDNQKKLLSSLSTIFFHQKNKITNLLNHFINNHIYKINYLKQLDNTIIDFGQFKGQTYKWLKINQSNYCKFIINNFDKNKYKEILFYLNLK